MYSTDETFQRSWEGYFFVHHESENPLPHPGNTSGSLQNQVRGKAVRSIRTNGLQIIWKFISIWNTFIRSIILIGFVNRCHPSAHMGNIFRSAAAHTFPSPRFPLIKEIRAWLGNVSCFFNGAAVNVVWTRLVNWLYLNDFVSSTGFGKRKDTEAWTPKSVMKMSKWFSHCMAITR